MKRTLLLASLVLISLSAFSQTDKGWRSVGGTGILSLNFKDKAYNFTLQPEMYWFVANSFGLGLDFGTGIYSLKPDDSTSISQASLYVTPGMRFYFSDPEHKWRPYAFGNAGYELYSTRTKYSSVTTKNSDGSFLGYAGVGLAWFFSDHAAFDTRLHLIDFSRNDVFFKPTFSIGIQAFFD